MHLNLISSTLIELKVVHHVLQRCTSHEEISSKQQGKHVLAESFVGSGLALVSTIMTFIRQGICRISPDV
jgi:hypothetical protein